MNTVGNKGTGESVWLGFFVYDVINRFIPIMKKYEEINNNNLNLKNNPESKIENETIKTMNAHTIERYEKCITNLKKSINSEGWDGRWYKRAFTDDGDELRKP